MKQSKPDCRTASCKGKSLTPYLLICPAVIYISAFQLYPLLQELYLSFTSTHLIAPQDNQWIGLNNYRYLLVDIEFSNTVVVTLIYTVVCVSAAITLGLCSALLLDRAFSCRGLARAVITIPWASPPVAVALIALWIYNAQYGIFGRMLRFFGLESGWLNWLDTPAYALTAVLMTTIWQIFPFSSVVLLAALQSVSHEQREAAIIDGADALNVFKAVTWPTIRPSIMLLTLFSTIWSLRRFDLLWLLTQGGPLDATNTLVIDVYRRAFIHQELGEAAAVGMVGVTLAFVVTIAYFRYTAKVEKQVHSDA